MPKPAAALVDAAGREVRVSSPDRVIYPATETTPEVSKLMVAQFVADVGPALLRALDRRPTALERWPDGVHPGFRLATGRAGEEAEAFYQKRVPKGAPEYLQSVQVTFPSGRTAEEICPTEVAVLVWCAHMGTITFHPWPVRASDTDRPDELRIDLDPQPGTTFADCVRVAKLTREVLAELGLTAFVKTSGHRGLHVFTPIHAQWEFVDVRHAAIALARELERRDEGVTSNWWKEERGERIFIDYNQNNRDRTIASAYSLRPLAGAPVSTPLTWDELRDDVTPAAFNLFSVPQRLRTLGDPWAEKDSHAASLQPLLDMWQRDLDAGLGELNYPPDYPKMPGEPPRVQPSRKVESHWDEHGNRVEP